MCVRYLSKTVWGEITSLSMTVSAIRGVNRHVGFLLCLFFFFSVVTREKNITSKKSMIYYQVEKKHYVEHTV